MSTLRLFDQLRARCARVVRTLEVPVQLADDDLAMLRLEILEKVAQPGSFRARVWRIESYRLQSTFPQENGEPSHSPSDELILKDFEGFESPLQSAQPFVDANQAEEYVLKSFVEWLTALGIDSLPDE